VNLKSRNLIRFWWVPALAVLVASLAWTLRDGLLVKQELKVHGVGIEATVTGLVEVNPAKSGPCLAAAYRFTDPGGGAQTGRVGCRETADRGLRPGATVHVTYLPDDPTTHRPGRFQDYSLWRELLLTLAVVGAGVLLLLLASLAWIRFTSRTNRPRSP
jgi:hypothetical protein